MKCFPLFCYCAVMAASGALAANPKTIYLELDNPAVIETVEWGAGGPEWPLTVITLPKEVRDFRGYDRLAVDFISETEGVGARMRCYLAGPDTPVHRGASPGAGFVPVRGLNRWEIPLDMISSRTNPSNVAQIQFWFWRARALKLRFFRMTLLDKGQSCPPLDGCCMAKIRRSLDCLADDERRANAVHLSERTEAARRYRAACSAAGQTGAFCLGVATAMENIRPREGVFPSVAKALSLRLARGEKESLQVFVTPKRERLKNVRLSVSPLVDSNGASFPSDRVEISVLGYVNITNPPPYGCGVNVPDASATCGFVRRTEGCASGWWPDPILSFVKSVDVCGDDVQGFWIRVNARRCQRPGIYQGTIRISADGVDDAFLPISVRVNGFSVPSTPMLPLAITFGPKHIKHESMPGSPVVQWKKKKTDWADFLADHYLSFDHLYRRDNAFPEFDMLERQRRLGLEGKFNLGYWPLPEPGEEGKEKWRRETLPRLKRAYEKAKALGVLHRVYVYGCDEFHKDAFPRMKWAVGELHRELPGVAVSTTAFDNSYGVGTELSCIDWFTPQTEVFNPEQAAKARAEGRQVWWYFACDQKSPCANSFVECPAIEMRSVMGAQAVKFRPDGFLYYQMTHWNGERPIESGPFTDWNPDSWLSYHGDGTWVCCGPGGIPLSTVRLENFADGLEDYAYARLLEKKLMGNPDAPWADEARSLLSVPCTLVDTTRSFSTDPNVLIAWRDAMADLIDR